MKKYHIGIVGYLAEGISKAGGQEAKTCALKKLLEDNYGRNNVCAIDTQNWKKNPIKLFFRSIKMASQCRNIVILPAQNGVKVFIPFFWMLSLFFHFNVHYAVVGGWLPELTKNHRVLSFFAKKISCIYVETNSMKRSLEKQNFRNIIVLPNFKYLETFSSGEISYHLEDYYKVCTFSRVMKEKGIEDAINAVININEKYKKTVFELNIYGKVDDGYKIEFERLKETFPHYIQYCGEVPPEKSVEVLKKYFLLLFPTHYKTEGIPGTIIDAYSAAVPVITALWENCEDVFEHGVNGWGYEMENQRQLEKLLEEAYIYPNRVLAMKENCSVSAKKYTPDAAMSIIKRHL